MRAHLKTGLSQKAVKAQIIVKIFEKMVHSSEKSNLIDFLIKFNFIDFLLGLCLYFTLNQKSVEKIGSVKYFKSNQ